MKRTVLCILLSLLILVSLSACFSDSFSISSAPPESTDLSTGNVSLSQEPAWREIYAALLSSHEAEHPNSYCDYIVYDIDHDGVPELFIKVGTCEADYEFQVFTCSDSGPVSIGTLNGWHACLYGSAIKNELYLSQSGMGYSIITKVILSGNAFEEMVVYDGESEEIPDSISSALPWEQHLETYPLTDLTPLGFPAKPDSNSTP